MSAGRLDYTMVSGDNNKFELAFKYWVEESELWIEAALYPKGSMDPIPQVTPQHRADISLVFTDPAVDVCGGNHKADAGLLGAANWSWAESVVLDSAYLQGGREALS